MTDHSAISLPNSVKSEFREPWIERGTLGLLHPAFSRPVRPAPKSGADEHKQMLRLHRKMRDAADSMEIPRETAALAIARKLCDDLYSRSKAAPSKAIPHEPAHPNDPGTVLVEALRHFSNAVFAPSPLDDRPDVPSLRRLHDRLDDFLSGPPVRDIRHSPLHALRLMTARLISYYG
ncbi:hypothetical protein [Sphingobium sp. LF-16]|uniref:hypothetical protein n=1 Tax=Sphingobium sp. LF-16 TaxID=2185111 RepID=UPI0019D27BD3|nr:hypothetical protein [Sphingobium sp. LF-16]